MDPSCACHGNKIGFAESTSTGVLHATVPYTVCTGIDRRVKSNCKVGPNPPLIAAADYAYYGREVGNMYSAAANAGAGWLCLSLVLVAALAVIGWIVYGAARGDPRTQGRAASKDHELADMQGRLKTTQQKLDQVERDLLYWRNEAARLGRSGVASVTTEEVPAPNPARVSVLRKDLILALLNDNENERWKAMKALGTEMSWSARWIENTACDPFAAPVFRKQFTLDGPGGTAVLYITGVGFYVCTLNGRNVTDALLQPAFSKYDARVYYNEYDVTALLTPGTNVIEVTLGNGWYNEMGEDCFSFEHAAWKSPPQLICELILDGHPVVASDSTWLCAQSKTVYNCLRYGERYDASLPDHAFHPASLSRGVGGILMPQRIPPVRVRERIVPIRLPNNVYDVGKNISGDVEIVVQGARGSRVVLMYGELLDAEGNVTQANIKRHATIPRTQTDEYTLSGAGEEQWHANFCYKGFRYVQVSGDAVRLSMEARVYHTDLADAGGFVTDNPAINAIIAAVRQSTLTNFVHIPTDCPHREKNGWTGDAHIACEQALFQFRMTEAYIKWLDDLADCQRPSGQLPCVAPTSTYGYGWGSGATWDAALVFIPWELYRFTGDTAHLARYYGAMRRYVEYLTGATERLICTIGLGDWCSPIEAPSGNDRLLLTACFYRMAQIVSQSARLLGKASDADRFAELARDIAEAIHAELLPIADTQTNLSVLLYFGLTQDVEGDLRRLLKTIDAAGEHIQCGIFGAKYIVDVLTRHGHFDVAYRMMAKTDYPSYTHMLTHGSGTIWERWDGLNSQNHIMFGSIGAWYFKALAGICVDESEPGFTTVVLRPHFTADVRTLSAWHETPRGRLAVSYDREQVSVTLPPHTTAKLYLDGQMMPLAAGDQARSVSVNRQQLFEPFAKLLNWPELRGVRG